MKLLVFGIRCANNITKQFHHWGILKRQKHNRGTMAIFYYPSGEESFYLLVDVEEMLLRLVNFSYPKKYYSPNISKSAFQVQVIRDEWWSGGIVRQIGYTYRTYSLCRHPTATQRYIICWNDNLVYCCKMYLSFSARTHTK